MTDRIEPFFIDQATLNYRIGKRIREWREYRGRTQREAVLDLVPWGWHGTQSQWASIEAGKRKVTLAEAWIIEQAMRMDLYPLGMEFFTDERLRTRGGEFK